MSYIINNGGASPFVSIKITEKGRESLSKGQLNFTYYAIGDSEINYEREEIVNSNPTDTVLSGVTRILRPVDRQPNIISFITSSVNNEPLLALTPTSIRTVKAVVNNAADERGFFSANTLHTEFITHTGNTYINSTGTILNSNLTGGTNLTLVSGLTVGDYLLIKLTNDIIGTQTVDTNLTPIPHLWFKIQAVVGSQITVDRALPNIATNISSSSQYIIYRGGEVYDSIATGTTSAYWDTGTLSFNACCDVTCSDVPVWNMNNIWCETLAGVTGTTYEDFTKFGSYQYLGVKSPYLQYNCISTATTTDSICFGPGLSVLDDVSKSISVLHYTNKTISNLYGEFFHIDGSNDKMVKVHYPDLMYHRRNYSTGSGTTQGMRFIASGDTKTLGTTDIQYIDLIEDSTLISDTAKTIGKVFPQLKIVVIDDDEIVAATSYKSNRNWTLPPLSANLVAPSGGTSTGILAVGETMYLTYSLENNTSSGITTTIPCQKYIKISNITSNPMDVEFKIDGVGLLPYMRKIEAGGYDGNGFYAYNFKVLYQIVTDIDDRPNSDSWKVYDFTSTSLTTNPNETIDPIALENQSPIVNGFKLTTLVDSATTIFDITQAMSMAPNVSPNNLQFGDERFFYGNIETYIGASIYKTYFDVRINSGQFDLTSNPTRSTDILTNPPDIMVSDVGIYNSNKELVVIGKLSKPIKLTVGNSIMLELSIDF